MTRCNHRICHKCIININIFRTKPKTRSK
ncbi:hypothetical protein DRP43_01905 [candidate division TA06 bacterium]|uniref:Uncharacterized protein n=1 Tax=candidate division TA06 bacterium TaxID=2250710 RepID=A0A660SPG0_UNCT6|nr:MAG: hypothetical protein DRP43_01905 [candidate division TA06 bacterium]